MSWHSIPVQSKELCIRTTLRCGQSFRWKETGLHEYSCAINGRLLSLRQDTTQLYYKVVSPPVLQEEHANRTGDSKTSQTDASREEFELQETQRFLKHYLNLEPNLQELYADWSEKDKNFAKRAPNFHGVRILKQDAWEALAGFICSSCNNIKRISQMMDKLCANYGPLIGYINDEPFYDMPSPSALVNPRVEAELRELGFGYRAAYLNETARMIAREKEGWLDSLRNPESPVFGNRPLPAGPMLPEGREGYRVAHAALVELSGVGAKVADCVCLFGLGWGEAVPVDTHVWQIAQRDYGFGRGKHKSLTKATYDAVANHFRSLWGKEAGWAHSVLFTADLRDFADRLIPESIKTESLEIVKAEPSAELGLESDTSGLERLPPHKAKYAKLKCVETGQILERHDMMPPDTVYRFATPSPTEPEVKEETMEDHMASSLTEAENSVLKTEKTKTEIGIIQGANRNTTTTSYIKMEEENTIQQRSQAAAVARSESRKRKTTSHHTQEKPDGSEQFAKPIIKRRRSDRLHR